MKTYLSLIIISLLSVSILSGEKSFYQDKRASWVDDGIISGGGSHEPFIFRIRRGGAGNYDDEYQKWLNEHSEESVRAAQKAGIEVFHTHGYKGFGYEAEKAGMEMLADLSALVHKHGMKLDTYLQVMTFVPETFLAEIPESENWVQRDELGRPIRLTYGFQQSYRLKPSLASPEYREYYKEKIIRTLVEKCKTDMLHFDNYDCNREPESDKSPQAVAAFHQYLEQKYPTNQSRIERFGHVNLEFIEPPEWNMNNRPQDIEVIRDPVQQEWIDFRCWLMADWLKDITTFARSLNPELAIDTNPHGLYGRNRAFQAALWHPWFMKFTELTWSEEQSYSDYNEAGVLVSKIRTFKLGRTLDNIILTYKGDERQHAENLSFNQTLGNIDLKSDNPSNHKYHRFYLKNRELYRGTDNREDVAVLRSYATMAYDNHRAELEECMFEQALIQGQVPFDIIFDEQMDNLSKYKVIALAGQVNLSDENTKRIIDFVENGGGLVFTGMSSTRDHWGRTRSNPSLADIAGIDKNWESTRPGALSDKPMKAKDGRIFYVPEIIAPDKEIAANWTGAWDGHLGRGNWILPVNSSQLVDAVRSAAGGRFSVEADLPNWVAIEQVEKEGMIAVHFVNYRKDSKLSNIKVSIELKKGERVKSLTLISPDIDSPVTLEYSQDCNIITISLPSLEVYDVVRIDLR